MDYEKLYQQLPKQPIKWTVADIQIWLQFIGLQSLYPKFKQLAIDGSILNSLTEQDFRQQLLIKSSITLKKINSWVTRGLKEYETYLKELVIESGSMMSTHKPKHNKKPSLMMDQQIPMGGSIRQMSDDRQIPSQKPMIRTHSGMEMALPPYKQSQLIEEEQQEDQRRQLELVIQQCDGPQNSFYSVKEGGAKIGRHSSNQILILDQSISRYHAEVIFQNQGFYLKDTGSTTGTFLKVVGKCQIHPNMIFEMGSNQFQSHLHNSSLVLSIVEGPSLSLPPFQIPKHKVSIGRNQNNELSFPDDQHLSNNHANILYLEGKYILEDLGTTNGTWRRLSMEGDHSELHPLQEKTIFKIGSSQTYSCRLKTSYVTDRNNPNACIICYENDKDCVYMPCKHNTACIKCSKNLKQCPICRIKIEDFIRIYKG